MLDVHHQKKILKMGNFEGTWIPLVHHGREQWMQDGTKVVGFLEINPKK